MDFVTELRQEQVRVRSAGAMGSLLNSENERLRSVFGALPMGILVLRGSNRVVYANELATKLVALRDDEEPFLEGAGGSSKVIGLIRTILSGDLARGIRSDRFQVDGEKGAPIFYRIRLVSGPLAAGLLERENLQIITFEDVTIEESTQRNRSEFAYGVSHELKTPLSSIRASLEMLVGEDALDDQDRKRLLDLSYSEALRLGTMVRELVDLSSIEVGATEIMREPLLVTEMMEELEAVHKPLAERKMIEMEWSVSSFIPPVMGDRDLLMQVFVNLIGNAIKYTPNSGRVGISVSVEGKEVRVRIADSGIGIPKSDLPKIFDKFYRSDAAKEASLSGTGLGLAVARYIVETHGGRVEVESIEGSGSTFTVYMPSHEAEEVDTHQAGTQSVKPSTRGYRHD